jgi:tRNA1Val (adenine37-N6)-methyltransferase
MKVCTDSCLFGAWVANKFERKTITAKNILDIGTGTGLLSLMIAQKSFAETDAIEIDENSFIQAKDNFAKSPWNQRLHAINADVKNWLSPHKYDLIVSNPPFFENDLRSVNQNKNIAKHHDALTLKDLIRIVSLHLADNGNFAILLPFHRVQFFKTLALENNFYLNDELLIQQTPRHSFFRGMLFFGSDPVSLDSKKLTIQNDEGSYTKESNMLLKDYYL